MSDPVTRLNAAPEGRDRIESELGDGGMATVYLAADIKHERKVALTMLRWALAILFTASPLVAQENIGRFVFEARSDASTDIDESLVYTRELPPTVLQAATLSWRCDGLSRVELFVSDEFLNSEAAVPMIWRFDNLPLVRSRWSVATNGTGAFAPQADIADFTNAARASGQLVVRITDPRGVDHDLGFSMAGATAALDRLPCRVAFSALEDEAVARGRAAADTLAERRAQESPPDWAEWVGRQNSRVLYPLDSDCWRVFVPFSRAIFFRSLAEASRVGFFPSQPMRRLCR